jgi:N5-(cytidine 5'-diphosphoramidyl)-L-glutamine hydrolase
LKIVAISSRVDEVIQYSESRDALDQRWSSMLASLGIVPLIIPNTLDDKSFQYLVENVHFSGLILSGGNDLSAIPDGTNSSIERDKTEAKLINFCIQNKHPILGVCRGMQILVEYLGGSLIKIQGHIGVPHPIHVRESTALSFEGNSFHAFAPNKADLPACLTVTANSQDGQIEAVRHDSLAIEGIMWHPERNATIHPYDESLFKRMFQL